eukprot:11487833-Karenia_brevis.AAC.1
MRAIATSVLKAGCANPEATDRSLILMISIWRVVFGTLPFAVALGPVYAWSYVESGRVQQLVRLIWKKGTALVDIFITNAYTSPRLLRNGIFNANEERMEKILATR